MQNEETEKDAAILENKIIDNFDLSELQGKEEQDKTSANGGEIVNHTEEPTNRELNKTIEESQHKNETRGRHVKSCTCEKCEKRRTEKNNISETKQTETNNGQPTQGKPIATQSEKIDFSEFRETKVSPTNADKPIEQNVAKFMTGAILLMVCNAVIPSVCLFVIGFFEPRAKLIQTDKVKLDKSQITDLTPLADAAIKEMVLTMSATTAFFVTMFILFGANIMGEISEIKPEQIEATEKKKGGKK
jgi:hypothetical protein